jgi:hypothetical protein
MNIEFEYRYRDWGNFKKYGAIVFGNRNCLTADVVSQRVSLALADGQSFSATECGVPDLFFDDSPFDPDLDHGSHEFYGTSETESPINDAANRDILDLLAEMKISVGVWRTLHS